MSIKKDYVKPSPEELQRQLDEKMKKFLEKGGKIEKLKPMKPTKDQFRSWKIQLLLWLSRVAQKIDFNYVGNWGEQKMNLPQWESRWRKLFAWYPVKLDDGEVVFFKRYWVNESYMQNPYNGAKGFMIKQRISLHDRIVDRLSKQHTTNVCDPAYCKRAMYVKTPRKPTTPS